MVYIRHFYKVKTTINYIYKALKNFRNQSADTINIIISKEEFQIVASIVGYF